MKKTFFTLAIAVFAMGAQAQVLEVTSIERVAMPEGVRLDQPVISPDGTFVVASDLSSTKLQKLDIRSGEVTTVAERGSMLDLKISADGSRIIYRNPQQSSDRRMYTSLDCYDLKSGTTERVVEPTRDLGGFSVDREGAVRVVNDGKMLSRGRVAESAPMVSIHRGHLQLTTDGETVTLDPQGKGSYLWPSISPDGTKISYYMVHRGAFVCNIDGSNPVALGNIQAPKWLDNGTLVAMSTEDNGEVVTAGKVVAVDLEGNSQDLTDASVIALYPSASADGKRVAFSTAQGGIYIINIK